MERVMERCGGAENFGSFARFNERNYLRDNLEYTQRIEAKHLAALRRLQQLYSSSK